MNSIFWFSLGGVVLCWFLLAKIKEHEKKNISTGEPATTPSQVAGTKQDNDNTEGKKSRYLRYGLVGLGLIVLIIVGGVAAGSGSGSSNSPSFNYLDYCNQRYAPGSSDLETCIYVNEVAGKTP